MTLKITVMINLVARVTRMHNFLKDLKTGIRL